MDADTIPIRRLIANLMSASAPIEEYLRLGKPLTAEEFDSLSLTISGLQTFLEIWKRKHDGPILPQFPGKPKGTP
jgi:hypothetical protein